MMARVGSLILVACGLGLGSTANAAPVGYAFSGNLTYSFDDYAEIAGYIRPGVTFAGRFTYDSEGVADSMVGFPGSERWGAYRGVARDILVSFDSDATDSVTFSDATASGYVGVANDPQAHQGDMADFHFGQQTFDFLPDGSVVVGYTLRPNVALPQIRAFTFFFRLAEFCAYRDGMCYFDRPEDDLFGSDAAPVDLVSAYSRGFSTAGAFVTINDPDELFGRHVAIWGHLTSLNRIDDVAEPAIGGMGILGAVGTAIARRRRKRIV